MRSKKSVLPEATSTSTPLQSGRYYNLLFLRSITATLSQASGIIRNDPALFPALVRHLTHQKNAAIIRRRYEEEGIQVPPVMMLSLTHRCNLACHGCYMQHEHRNLSPDMTLDQIRSLISQAVDLGISFLILAGGEPMIRKDEILTLAREFPELIVAVYTNGTLITREVAAELGSLKNLVPIISIEGGEEETDARRSDGVYASAVQAFSHLADNKVFFGCSVTVTCSNYADVVEDIFIREMVGHGCRLISYVEYVPVQSGTEDLVLSDLQHTELIRLIREFSEKYPTLFLSFPGDDAIFGGCLSAGRGFLHVNPSGDLEPCPAAPFSDMNITRIPLKEALQSEFLTRIRLHHGVLSESGGGCALWKNREWTRSMLDSG